jgi:hypothetical protein
LGDKTDSLTWFDCAHCGSAEEGFSDFEIGGFSEFEHVVANMADMIVKAKKNFFISLSPNL